MRSLGYGDILMLILQASLVIVIIALAIIIFSLVCMWKIFEKMGTAGWKAIIPIYNSYCLYSKIWETKYFWISFALGIVGTIAPYNGNVFFTILKLAISVATIVFYILTQIHFAKAFQQGIAFSIGLIILPIVFNAILAFGKMEYRVEKKLEYQSVQDIQPDK